MAQVTEEPRGRWYSWNLADQHEPEVPVRLEPSHDPSPDRSDLADRLREQRARRARPLLHRGPRRDTLPDRLSVAGMGRASRRIGSGRVEPLLMPPLAVRVLTKAGYGPRPGDVEAFEALGTTDETRLEAWVEQQLHPEDIADDECDARLAAAGFTTLGKSFAELWADHYADDPEWYVRLQPILETERAAFLRAVWSRRQLTEVLAELWHDHFNVYGWDYIAAPTWVSWDRDVIRGHMLGNFREMLEAVATSPAMLVYLDNWLNHVAGPNENWARELFELHTLGAINYLGVGRQDEVPRDGDGRPVGYVDGDVYEATRCFTGWTLDDETGATVFRTDWHDRFQKYVLGRFIANDQAPFVDGRQVLDMLAEHPGTARHVAAKLARRLIADDPPEDVIEAAAAVFHHQRHAPDQLQQVVRTVLLSEAFRSTWGRKVKRPFEIVVGALRATGAGPTFSLDEHATDALLWLFEASGHARFSWRPPDGFPDRTEDWLGTGGMVATWRVVNWLSGAHKDDSDALLVDVISATPEEVASARALADHWIARLLARPVSETFRREVTEFMAQGRNPDLPLRLADDEGVQQRLQTMVALILISPDFMWR